MTIDTAIQPDYNFLERFDTEADDDGQHVMLCDECETVVCYIEVDDTLAEWISAAYSHECEAQP